MVLKVDDVVLCTVKSMQGTTVFLEIDEFPEYQASMVFSEVAAGRIRNLRMYVSPNRKIVCKVLKISKDHAELSLRRVTAKEREYVLDKAKKERTLQSILKTVVDNPTKVVDDIKKDYDVIDFMDELAEDTSVLEKYVCKSDAEKIAKIFSEKEGREKEIRRKFVLMSSSEDGVEDIQQILDVDANVYYLGSSQFSISVTGTDFKEADSKMGEVLEEIEKRVKKKGAIFELKKEKKEK